MPGGCDHRSQKACSRAQLSTDPSFCPLQTSSPVPQRPSCHPGLVDAVHRVRGRPRVTPPPPPELGHCCWPVGCETGQTQWGLTLTRLVWVHPLATSIYPVTTVPTPPPHYSPYSEWHEWAERALIRQTAHLCRNEFRGRCWGGRHRRHFRAEGGVPRAVPARWAGDAAVRVPCD